MKKKRLNLESFKVKSFVTNLEEIQEETVKGGIVPTHKLLICELPNDTFNPICGPTYGVCAYSGNICESEFQINCPAEV